MSDPATTPGGPRLPIEALRRRLAWSDLSTDFLDQLIDLARGEDIAGAGLAAGAGRGGDPSTELTDRYGAGGEAELRAREPLVLAGIGLVPQVLARYGEGCRFERAAGDGDRVEAGGAIGRLGGPAGVLLRAERVMLNFLQHLCGIASLTADYRAALGDSPTVLLDTRKTTPGHRVLEKYAVACGGGCNHRIGLFDRIMLKDNHLAVAGARSAGRLTAIVREARRARPDLPVEVEVDALEQVDPVLEAGADIVLLDNFAPDALREAVARIKGRAWSEASGGIRLDRMRELGSIGLDFISTGATVHQSRWKDIGLDWVTGA